VSIAQFSAGGAEAAGRSAGREQGWDCIDSVGGSGNDAAEAIGTEECARLRASGDAQE